MERFLIPYLTADDIINDTRRRQAEWFAEMMRRDDAEPLPPEPDRESVGDRVRGALRRTAGRLTGRTEGAGV